MAARSWSQMLGGGFVKRQQPMVPARPAAPQPAQSLQPFGARAPQSGPVQPFGGGAAMAPVALPQFPAMGPQSGPVQLPPGQAPLVLPAPVALPPFGHPLDTGMRPGAPPPVTVHFHAHPGLFANHERVLSALMALRGI